MLLTTCILFSQCFTAIAGNKRNQFIMSWQWINQLSKTDIYIKYTRQLELDVLDLRQSSPVLTQTLKLRSEWLFTFSGCKVTSFFQPTDRETRAHQHRAGILCPLELLSTKKNPKTKHGHTGVSPEEENQVVWCRATFYSRRGWENWVCSVLKREDGEETLLVPTSAWSELGQWSQSLLGGAWQQDKKWKKQVGTQEIQIIY